MASANGVDLGRERVAMLWFNKEGRTRMRKPTGISLIVIAGLSQSACSKGDLSGSGGKEKVVIQRPDGFPSAWRPFLIRKEREHGGFHSRAWHFANEPIRR